MSGRGTTMHLVQLVLDAGAAGLVAGEVQGVKSAYTANLLAQAATKGRLWRVMRDHRWRYFGMPEWAQAYARQHGLQVDGVARKRAHKASLDAGTFAPPTVRFGRGPAHEPGEPVITTRTRIVHRILPQQPPTAPRVVDARECRPWALETHK